MEKMVWTGAAALIGTLLIFSAHVWSAPQPGTQETNTRLESPGPTVTIAQAVRVALDNVPGRAHEVDLVEKERKLIWAVEIITPDERHFIVSVDGTTRAVTSVEEKTIEKLAGDPLKGRVIYEQRCTSCHGPQGKGDGPFGKLLIPPAPDLTTLQHRSKSDAELLHILQGGQSEALAGLKSKSLPSKQEARDVFAYLRTLTVLEPSFEPLATGPHPETTPYMP